VKSLLFFLFSIHLSFAGDLAIVVSQKTVANESWSKVVSALQEKMRCSDHSIRKFGKGKPLPPQEIISSLRLLRRHPS